MQSGAETVEAYLAELPEDRRAAISAVRDLVLANLPDGYVEAMNWGMISYEVPLARSGKTYNGKPLMYAALASQKNHMALYLCGLNCVSGLKDDLKTAYAEAGKKFDMGAACLRFKSLEQFVPEAVAEAIAAVPVEDFVDVAKAAHRRR